MILAWKMFTNLDIEILIFWLHVSFTNKLNDCTKDDAFGFESMFYIKGLYKNMRAIRILPSAGIVKVCSREPAVPWCYPRDFQRQEAWWCSSWNAYCSYLKGKWKWRIQSINWTPWRVQTSLCRWETVQTSEVIQWMAHKNSLLTIEFEPSTLKS